MGFGLHLDHEPLLESSLRRNSAMRRVLHRIRRSSHLRHRLAGLLRSWRVPLAPGRHQPRQLPHRPALSTQLCLYLHRRKLLREQHRDEQDSGLQRAKDRIISIERAGCQVDEGGDAILGQSLGGFIAGTQLARRCCRSCRGRQYLGYVFSLWWRETMLVV